MARIKEIKGIKEKRRETERKGWKREGNRGADSALVQSFQLGSAIAWRKL